ncbi:Smr/MutS family protein [Celeribacter arenosi]|uniref:Smr/MutS family protein n=1 Tax=Celeribacter arenosi TaxID=792649 RepID=A0ABP7JYN5_9RHOB
MSRRRKGLTPEDLEVWEAVRKTAEPLQPKIPFATSQDTPAKPVPKAKKPRFEVTDFRLGDTAPARQTPHDIAPPLSHKLDHAPLNMDRKRFGKMKKGKLAPEARIDLHGMTLAAAHPALTGFILSSHAAGRRLVLVITGKGKHRDDGGPIPVRHGVLRHQVPHWLHSAPLKSCVLQVSQAHVSHGGEGALYVYLRRHK